MDQDKKNTNTNNGQNNSGIRYRISHIPYKWIALSNTTLGIFYGGTGWQYRAYLIASHLCEMASG